MIRVLVLGATGMLGHTICEELAADDRLEVHASARGDVVDRPTRLILHEGIDVSRGASILGPILSDVAPDVIVNAIGAIKQKDLRAAMDETFYVNAVLPHLLAQLTPTGNTQIIHVSTDCVFAGDRGAYKESDRPDVTDLYGRSKAVGEIDYGPHLTLRTSIVGFERRGFLGLLSWLCSHPRGATVKGYVRAIYSGLPTVTLARTIREVVLRPAPLRGLYHVASEPISKFELLVRLNEALGLGICIEPDGLLHIDRSLDDSRFRQATGSVRPSWTDLVSELKQDYFDHHYDDVYELRRRARAEDACSPGQ